MSNRVEDLEQQVAELQAAVNGLTEELVETKARVRQLEDDREADVERRAQPAAGPVHAAEAAAATSTNASATDASATNAAGPSERTTHSDDHTHVVKRTDAGSTESESSDTDGAVSDSDDMVVAEQDVTTPDAEAAKSEERGGEDEQESDTSDIIIA